MTKNERLIEVNKLLNSKAFENGDVTKVVERVKTIYPLTTKMTCIDGQLCKCLLKAIPSRERAVLRQSKLYDYISVVSMR